MFGIVNYGLFVLSGILLNIIPGSDTIYILSRSISQGKKAGVLSVFGIISGAFIHTLLVALGLSVILRESVFIFNLVKYIGAGYLVYLGIKNLLLKTSQFELGSTDTENGRKIYLQDMLTNLTNPKVALFYLAFLPQFVSTNNPYGVLPFIILGLTFITTATIWCLMLATFSSYATAKIRKNQNVSNILNKVTGIIFIGMGLNLLRLKASN